MPWCRSQSLVIFDEKGNMLKKGALPYGIRRFGDMHAIFLKELLVGLEKALVQVKKATAGLHAESLDMAIETCDRIIRQVREVHGQEAVDENFRRGIVAVELNEDILQLPEEIGIAHEKVVGADHHDEHLGVGNLCLYCWQGAEKIGCSGAWNTEVFNLERRHAGLPVVSSYQRIAEE